MLSGIVLTVVILSAIVVTVMASNMWDLTRNFICLILNKKTSLGKTRRQVLD